MKSNYNTLIQVIYFLLIIFLSYVLMNKLLDINSFQVNILKTGIFNSQNSKYLSYTVVATEFIVLMFLVFKKQIGLLLFFLMTVIFTIYISFLFYNNKYEVCGCGGVLNGLQFKFHLLINLGLIIFSYLTLKYSKE